MNVILFGGAAIGSVITILLFMGVLSFFSEAEDLVNPNIYSFFKDIVGPIAAGFGGAIAGALTTYKVTSESQVKSDGLMEARNYNRGINILVSKLNELASIKRSIIIPHEDDVLRFTTIPALAIMDKDRGRAETWLTEILITLESYEVIQKMVLAEEFYDSLRSALGERNRMVERYGDQFDRSAAHLESRLSLNDLVLIHGIGSTIKLYSYTEQLISMLDDSITHIAAAIDLVGDTCVEKIKGRGVKILKYKLDENDLVYAKTKPPYFKSPQHLRDVITSPGSDESLATSSWQPINYRSA